VLSAGTVGSTRLLLRSRAALPQLSRALGRRVSANGDLLMFARDTRSGHPRDEHRPWRYLDPSFGPAITTSVRVPAAASPSGREHYVQDSGAPAFTEWIWQGTELPGDLWAQRGVAWRRLKERLTGHRDEHVSGELAGLFGSAHASAAMMPMLGMGQDVADGRLHLDADGGLDLAWEDEASRPHYAALRDTAAALTHAMGGEFTEAPLSHTSTVHPVGGGAMAHDPADGVVDAFGRVHGHPGLHVADGSVMPGPVGPNPSFTIAALADRFADAMIADGPRVT
jgi:cholesterol oxidase